jgi:hypothetical protein
MRIHRRESRRVGRRMTYRGTTAKAMGEPYLDEVVEAEAFLAEYWDPSTMTWNTPEDIGTEVK